MYVVVAGIWLALTMKKTGGMAEDGELLMPQGGWASGSEENQERGKRRRVLWLSNFLPFFSRKVNN
jgi:hypothetical protein